MVWLVANVATDYIPYIPLSYDITIFGKEFYWNMYLGSFISSCVELLYLSPLLYPIIIFRESKELQSRIKWKNLCVSYGLILVINGIIITAYILLALGRSIPTTVG